MCLTESKLRMNVKEKPGFNKFLKLFMNSSIKIDVFHIDKAGNRMKQVSVGFDLETISGIVQHTGKNMLMLLYYPK